MRDAEGIQMRVSGGKSSLRQKYKLFTACLTIGTHISQIFRPLFFNVSSRPRQGPCTKKSGFVNLQAIRMFSSLFAASYKMLLLSLQLKHTLFALDLYNNNDNHTFYS